MKRSCVYSVENYLVSLIAVVVLSLNSSSYGASPYESLPSQSSDDICKPIRYPGTLKKGGIEFEFLYKFNVCADRDGEIYRMTNRKVKVTSDKDDIHPDIRFAVGPTPDDCKIALKSSNYSNHRSISIGVFYKSQWKVTGRGMGFSEGENHICGKIVSP